MGCSLWGRKESDTTERLHFLSFYSSFWRRKWQPTPMFLPGESHGRRGLVGCSLWGCKESNTTKQLTHTQRVTEIVQIVPCPFPQLTPESHILHGCSSLAKPSMSHIQHWYWCITVNQTTDFTHHLHFLTFIHLIASDLSCGVQTSLELWCVGSRARRFSSCNSQA